MLVDIPQLVIELNEPIRDCPPLFGWVLTKIEPSPTQPLFHATGDDPTITLEPFKLVSNVKPGKRPQEFPNQFLFLEHEPIRIERCLLRDIVPRGHQP